MRAAACRSHIAPETYSLQLQQHRAACLLAFINLHRLMQALLLRAPDKQLRAIQGVEDWQPCSTVNTCIIRHRDEVHEHVYAWKSFVAHYGHGFDAVQVQRCLQTNHICCSLHALAPHVTLRECQTQSSVCRLLMQLQTIVLPWSAPAVQGRHLHYMALQGKSEVTLARSYPGNTT